ncbi:MAG: adenylate/guanylate cyclase domain-containing protein, partial [Myxococcota bacterium]|nr:adenylate/guanylate cyclase domain-containing protein [Myxococcota bacterium]
FKQSEVVADFRVVSTALEARAIFEESRVHCILSDFLLGGEDGIRLMNYIQTEHGHTHRVLLTGQTLHGKVMEAQKTGLVQHVFFKPVNNNQVVRTIESMVSKAKAEMSEPEEEIADDFEVKSWLIAEDAKTGVMDDDEQQDVGLEGSGELILVVDDLKDIRDMVASALRGSGYRVITAANGQQALDKALLNCPDLVVTDWMMPEMSGPDLIRAVRQDELIDAIPIVLLTAKSDQESKLMGTELGADAFLGKPFNDAELLSVVRNLLSLKSREREVVALNHELTEKVLKRYLPPDLVDQIILGEVDFDQEPESINGTILFSDLVGFTALSGRLRATKLARVLNEYLTEMVRVIYQHGGTIDKFIGDAVMVIFGAPKVMVGKEQALKAVQCALAMQAKLDELNARWDDDALKSLQMRIGIHHGPLVVGTFGSEERSDYTAIGPTVNTASRVESACEPGDILVSGEICDFLPEAMAEEAGLFELKGVGEQVPLYRIISPEHSVVLDEAPEDLEAPADSTPQSRAG